MLLCATDMAILFTKHNTPQLLASWRVPLVAGLTFTLTYLSFYGLPQQHVDIHANLRYWGLGSPTVQDFFLDAQHSHNDFIARQSTNVEQAIATYQDRYSRNPPYAFKYWFEMAQKWSSPVIDDFDNLHAHLAPFRTFFEEKRDLEMADNEVESLWASRLLRMCIRRGQISFQGFQEDWFVKELNDMVGEFANHIPDLCVLVNTLDEPRSLLLPHRHQHEPAENSPHSPNMISSSDHGDLWAEIHAPCDSQDIPSPPPHHHTQFAEIVTDTTDLCQHTSSPHYGLITSPESSSITHDTVPIVSNARLSTFSDILFPSVWRYSEHNVYDPTEDMPWETKSNHLYWRGSTTGGHASNASWTGLHRQKLVQRLAALKDSTLDVAFTAVIQCDEPVCDTEEYSLPMDEHRPMGEAWKHKLLLDMDGNGLSGRYYGLLRSNSAVIRHSLMQEWSDARLQPWLHYIPLTAEADELPDLVSFFQTPEGDEIARAVARYGKSWAERALRPIDQRLYFFRVLIEMARDR